MAFTGRAATDDFLSIGQDISDIMLLLSPRETPLLDILPTPNAAATNVEHDWREAYLGPDRLVCSVAVNSASANTGIQIDAKGNYLQVGMLLEAEPAVGVGGTGNQELMQIVSIPGANSILVSRGFGGTGINSLVAGNTLFVIGTAALEGADIGNDVSRNRVSQKNYTQIFEKSIIISGTARAVKFAPDTGDEFDYQTTLRAIELARDLEKAMIRGVAANSIGNGTSYRTMDGIRARLTTNNSLIVATSFAAAPIDYVNDGLQNCWNVGARDLDVLVVGDQWKRSISGANLTKLLIEQSDTGVIRRIETIQTDFGELRIILSPWMPSYSMMGLATRRIFPTPLRGRSFQRTNIAQTGDASKAMIIGEYTLELHHQEAMFQAHAI